MFEVSINEALEFFESVKSNMKGEEDLLMKYRLHMFAPMQLLKLIEMKNEQVKQQKDPV